MFFKPQPYSARIHSCDEPKRATGAQIVALGGDAAAIESGQDNSALGDEGWEPVEVDRVVEDGDTLTVGGVTLRALWTGRHTQGATMWVTTLKMRQGSERVCGHRSPIRGRIPVGGGAS